MPRLRASSAPVVGTLTKCTWRTMGWGFLASLLLAVPLWAQDEITPEGDRSRVVSIGVLPSSDGSLLTERRLLWSHDDGAPWRDDVFLAPPDSLLHGALFSNGLTGWAIVSGVTGTDIVRTTDGGTTWEHSTVAVPGSETPSGGSVSFIDDRRGLLMLRLPSSANISQGALFQTADGGRTWQTLPPPPIGDPIRFVSEQDGWLAGGCELFVTRDGGAAWDRTKVAASPGAARARLLYALPVFDDASKGLLPVRVDTAVASSIALYATHNRGVSWVLLGRAEGTAQDPAPLNLRDGRIITTGSGGTMVTLGCRDDAADVRRETPTGLPLGFGITGLSLSDARQGWDTAVAEHCVGFNGGCWHETRILRTTDGAASLERITPGTPKPHSYTLPIAGTTC